MQKKLQVKHGKNLAAIADVTLRHWHFYVFFVFFFGCFKFRRKIIGEKWFFQMFEHFKFTNSLNYYL